jgi:hypothetical protein
MPTIEDLLIGLKSMLSPTDDGAFISDEMALTFAIDEIKRLRERADLTAWRDVATDPPPESTEVLFYGGGYWVGYAKTTTFHDIDTGEETAEVAYYFEGDLMDGDAPTVWCHIPPGDGFGDGQQAAEEKEDGEE